MVAMDADINHIEYENINPPVIIGSKVNHVSQTTKFVNGKVVTFDMSSLDKAIQENEQNTGVSIDRFEDNVERGINVIASVSKEDSPETMGKKFGQALKEIYANQDTVDFFRSVRQRQEQASAVSLSAFRSFHNQSGNTSEEAFQARQDAVDALYNIGFYSLEEGSLSNRFKVSNKKFNHLQDEDRELNSTSVEPSDYAKGVASLLPVSIKLSRFSERIESIAFSELSKDKSALQNFKLVQSEVRKIAKLSEQTYSEGYQAMSVVDRSMMADYNQDIKSLKKAIRSFETDFRKACVDKGVPVSLDSYELVQNNNLDARLGTITSLSKFVAENLVSSEKKLNDSLQFAETHLNTGNHIVRNAMKDNRSALHDMAKSEQSLSFGKVTGGLVQGYFQEARVEAEKANTVSADTDIVDSFTSKLDGTVSLSTKADHLQFLQSVGSGCLKEGMANRDVKMVQLGRFIHSFQKKLSADCYNAENVEHITREIFKREEASLGTYEAARDKYLGVAKARETPEIVYETAKSASHGITR